MSLAHTAFPEVPRANVIMFRPKVETPLPWLRLADNILKHRHEAETTEWFHEIVYFLMSAHRCEVEFHHDLLQKFEPLYSQLTEILQFRTEEYPRLLHIALELERQGMRGDVAERIIHWVRSRELLGAEQSDDRRLYSSWLMWRRNVSGLGDAEDRALIGRMMRRFSRADVFAQLPMGVELARGITIMTAMGGILQHTTPQVEKSIQNAMFHAFLNDAPIALGRLISVSHMLGMSVPQPMENYLFRQVSRLRFEKQLENGQNDQLMLLFAAQPASFAAGLGVMQLDVPEGPFSAHLPASRVSPLREITDVLRGLAKQRSGDWHTMQGQIEPNLSFPAFNRLRTASACPGFEAFFEVFSRPYERL